MNARIAHGLVVLALFAGALAVFDAARPRVGFHGDESFWIATSRYFGYLFLQADPDREEWDETYWTLTQPPGFRYVLGAALTLQGHDLETLNRPYRWSEDLSDNRRKGRVPTNAVLMDARKATILLGAGAIALLYVVALQLGAPLAGAVAALLATGSSYVQEHFVHAMSESTFAFILLAALALCLAVFRNPATGFSLRSGLLVGLTLGAALSIKLTAVLSAPVLAAAVLTRGASRNHLTRPSPLAPRPFVWLATVGVTCWALFVALNPFLWPDPIGRTAAMFAHRQDEMRRQQNHTPKAAVWDPFDRPGLVLGHAFINKTWANKTLGVPLDVPLAALGLVGLGAAARGDWRRSRRIGPAAVLLLWLVVHWVGVTWAYALDWDRYVMPLFLLVALLSGYGVWTLRLLVPSSWRIAPRVRPRLPALGSRGNSRSAQEPSPP